MYTHRITCRCCGGSSLEKVIDFGRMPLAGGFLRPDQIADEKLYPLHVSFCHDCTLVQVPQAVPAEVLFKNYFFFSSAIKTLIDHCQRWAHDSYERFLKYRPDASVFEIGCNDGVMLKPFAALGVKAVGMDPATNVVESVKQDGFTIINDFLSLESARKARETHGRFDLIVTSYSFAHIDDMVSVIKGVKELLKDDGIMEIELYYLGIIIDEMQYDMIYHEHFNYYSLKSLGNFLGFYGMEIFDVKYTPGIRSGAVRFSARNIGKRKEPISDAVIKMRRDEEAKGYHLAATLKRYGDRIEGTKVRMLKTLEDLKAQGKSIIGYGASGRGTMIMNYCGIGGRYLDCVVEDAPAKHGFYTPGTHVKIVSWQEAIERGSVDHAILFAWSFKDEVLKKRQDYLSRGGSFILPLPDVQVVTGDALACAAAKI